jgi:hypothetical protein
LADGFHSLFHLVTFGLTEHAYIRRLNHRLNEDFWVFLGRNNQVERYIPDLDITRDGLFQLLFGFEGDAQCVQQLGKPLLSHVPLTLRSLLANVAWIGRLTQRLENTPQSVGVALYP